VKISAKSEYACLALLALARLGPEDPPARLREISEEHGIPERYLVQILLQLKGAGLVQSTRGASGGYRLARPADRISLAEVLTAIDGPDAPARRDARPAARALAHVWERARAAERDVLERTSIAQLVDRISPREWTI
jgi:Rrf2 family protein